MICNFVEVCEYLLSIIEEEVNLEIHDSSDNTKREQLDVTLTQNWHECTTKTGHKVEHLDKTTKSRKNIDVSQRETYPSL